MSRKCKLSGKKPLAGNNVSKAHNKTKRWQKPNIQYKRIYDPDTGRWIRIKLATSELRTISQLGLSKYLRKKGYTLKDLS